MQTVLTAIDTRARALRAHPFLAWLRDPALPARHRLVAWLPSAAPFVFGFMDLNADVLRYADAEADADPRKRAINDHLAEDAVHWPWYLHDLRQLGLDVVQPMSQTLRDLWGPSTRAQRLAMYRLCQLGHAAHDPALRYVLIAALEAVAHQLFAAVLEVATQFEQESGKKLLYLGPHHFEREPGHLTHQTDAADALFHDVAFDAATAADAVRLAGEVCDAIAARWQEFLANAQAQPINQSASTLATCTP